MKCYLFIVSAALLLYTGVPAQSPWKFRSSDYVGILKGEMGNYGQVQTINGLYNKSWFFGAGAGLDFYRLRSIPLFLSVTRDLLRVGKKSGLFIGLDAGTNIPWCSYSVTYMDTTHHSKFHPGLYWNALVGYRLSLSARHDQALLFSVGYSYKELTEDRPDPNPVGMCPVGAPCPFSNHILFTPDRYDYRNKRLSLQIGFQF